MPLATRPPGDHATPDWWRDAVIYQIYIRSFQDSDGDGIGDLGGIRMQLGYLSSLGVDAIWITPWYVSPMADGGYDVADYRAIDPRFGDLVEAEHLVKEAHEHDIRVLIDLVPNHTSDQHAWFQAALAAGPGSPERERYWFRPGRGADGELPPTDWRSQFGGSAWTRVMEPDGNPGEWYLHLYAAEQPDLNWDHPEVGDEFVDILRFWFDRGIDGFRIDVAHSLFKDRTMPDVGDREEELRAAGTHPHWDRDEVLEVYERWRRVAQEYDDERVFVAEAWVGSPQRLVRYLGDERLHTAFNFDFLVSAWDGEALRSVIEETLAAHATVGAPPTWVLANHDVTRVVTRLGREETTLARRDRARLFGSPMDQELGWRRARAAALLLFALPGGAYIYQGDELGLPEVEDLPDESLQDPTFRRTGGRIRGRDGCRVPLPWAGDEPPFGFGPPGGAAPWLPQPARWSGLTAGAQERDERSMLSLYRAALFIRRERTDLGDGPMSWLPAPQDVLAFERGGLQCIVNLSPSDVSLPGAAEVLLSSGPLSEAALPPDTAVWITHRLEEPDDAALRTLATDPPSGRDTTGPCAPATPASCGGSHKALRTRMISASTRVTV